jgi:taurine transport system permease protein
VSFPSVIPFFITGVRLAIGKGMIAVVVGEYIAATEGIGFRIRADAEVFNTSRSRRS